MAKVKRRTVKLRKIIDQANHTFEHSVDGFREGRIAIQMFVEKQLMDAGAYDGFRYLNGWPCEDDSRIAFYIKYELRDSG